METIIIEELSRNHKLIGRHKYTQQEIKIGRNYYNDIILTDPHICPEHVKIEFNGEHWLVHDLNSVNGTFLAGKKHSADQHIVQSGDILTIGKTLIRLVFPEHYVNESIIFSPFENFINFVKKPSVLIISALIFMLLTAYTIYLNATIKLEISKLLVPALGASLMILVWPISVALVSHFTKNDARIWSQIGITFIFMNIIFLVESIEKVFYFNSTSTSPLMLFMLVYLALSFGYFWLNTYIGFETTAKRRYGVALGLTLLFAGGAALIQISKQQEFSMLPAYDNTLMTPNYLFRTGVKPEKFISDADALFELATENMPADDE